MHTVVAVLLFLTVALTALCTLGLAVMKDAYQRLHFSAPVTSFSVFFLALAIWLEDKDGQARAKVGLIVLILFWMNGVLTHATARALRVREHGEFTPKAEEKIPIIGEAGKKEGVVR